MDEFYQQKSKLEKPETEESTTVGFYLYKVQKSANESMLFRIRGAWVVQSVKHLTSAQVMILRFVSSSPELGSPLSAQSPLQSLSLSLSLSKINKHKKIKKESAWWFSLEQPWGQ